MKRDSTGITLKVKRGLQPYPIGVRRSSQADSGEARLVGQVAEGRRQGPTKSGGPHSTGGSHKVGGVHCSTLVQPSAGAVGGPNCQAIHDGAV